MLPASMKKEKTPDAGELYGLLAEVESPGALKKAAEKIRDAGYTKWDCYSPFPVHGLDPAMGIKMTILPWIVFGAGLAGLGLGLLLQWWTNASFWPWIVSGKPFFSLPANVPITFETTILAAVFASFFGMWILNGLPQVWHPFFRSNKFAKVSDDGFFIGIEASDERFDREATEKLLKDVGATSVEAIDIDPDPEKKKMPIAIYGVIVVSTCAALVPFAMIAKARASKSRAPHYHVIPDMDFQEKLKHQRDSKFLGDPDYERIAIEGTAARQSVHNVQLPDPHLTQGISGSRWAVTFPPGITVNQTFIETGEQRYNTYCSPCHGVDGSGKGVVHERAGQLGSAVVGWSPPKNLVATEQYIKAPHGEIFNVITYGTSNQNMQGYAAQITPRDRWAIIAYLRALQLSANAQPEDFN